MNTRGADLSVLGSPIESVLSYVQMKLVACKDNIKNK